MSYIEHKVPGKMQMDLVSVYGVDPQHAIGTIRSRCKRVDATHHSCLTDLLSEANHSLLTAEGLSTAEHQ